ncbi:hypothetical protein ACMT1E_14095 [Sphingomonas flavalba]|uniref:hypothetical protein n=1 Tax=Sphingomonas flavalba TaxID=2559804 RepID=UPI0039E0C867
MKLLAALAAAGVVASLAIPAPAEARPRGYYSNHYSGYYDGYRDRYRPRYDRDRKWHKKRKYYRHRGAYYRPHCRWEWRHRHRVRVCY